MRFLIEDYKKLIKPSVKHEILEETPGKLIENTGYSSTCEKIIEDVKEVGFDITREPVCQMEGYDSDAPSALSINLDKYLYGRNYRGGKDINRNGGFCWIYIVNKCKINPELHIIQDPFNNMDVREERSKNWYEEPVKIYK